MAMHAKETIDGISVYVPIGESDTELPRQRILCRFELARSKTHGVERLPELVPGTGVVGTDAR